MPLPDFPGRRIVPSPLSRYLGLMQEQAFRWAPLTIALAAGLLILVKNATMTKERRSPGQWFIFRMYMFMQFIWALVRGLDVGYLEYRRVLQQTRIEVENERCLGKLKKGRRQDSMLRPIEQEA